MLEPDFLTVAELANRWGQTERQIIGHAEALRLPLYFAFEGLAFDVGDQWHRSVGTEFWGAQRKLDELNKSIDLWTKHLEKNARVLRGQHKPSEYEPYPLSREDVQKYRASIEADKPSRDALVPLLEQRERERRQFEYRGHMRATPKTIWDIATTGMASGVSKAFHPGHPIRLATIDGRQIVDGRLMGLEPLVAGYGWRGVLTASDMLITMADIKALEQTKPKAGAPALDGDIEKAPTPESDEQDLAALFDPVHYEALEKMFPTGKQNGWRNFADKAASNGLRDARQGRAMFNPMLAALWWLDKQHPIGWDLARVNRTLAKGLPQRSRGNEHLFTGDYD